MIIKMCSNALMEDTVSWELQELQVNCSNVFLGVKKSSTQIKIAPLIK